MISPLTIERFERFVSEHPDPETWEDAVNVANDKYDELFGKFFPMTYYSVSYEEILPELKGYPMIGTICLWHAIMDCVERRQEYEIPKEILEMEQDPDVCGTCA